MYLCNLSRQKANVKVNVKVNSLVSVTPGFGALYFIENSSFKAKQSAYLLNFKCTLFKLVVIFKFLDIATVILDPHRKETLVDKNPNCNHS